MPTPLALPAWFSAGVNHFLNLPKLVFILQPAYDRSLLGTTVLPDLRCASLVDWAGQQWACRPIGGRCARTAFVGICQALIICGFRATQ